VMRVCPIYLSEKEDQDLILFLEAQPPGKRSKAFKELARQALKERLDEKEQTGS